MSVNLNKDNTFKNPTVLLLFCWKEHQIYKIVGVGMQKCVLVDEDNFTGNTFFG